MRSNDLPASSQAARNHPDVVAVTDVVCDSGNGVEIQWIAPSQCQCHGRLVATTPGDAVPLSISQPLSPLHNNLTCMIRRRQQLLV